MMRRRASLLGWWNLRATHGPEASWDIVTSLTSLIRTGAFWGGQPLVMRKSSKVGTDVLSTAIVAFLIMSDRLSVVDPAGSGP